MCSAGVVAVEGCEDRPAVRPRRQLIDGIRFRVRTGVAWRDIPAEYGPWGRVYGLFRRWQRNGTRKDPHPASVPGRRKGCARPGSECRLHGVPRPSARGRGTQAGRPAEGTTGRHLHRAP
ncbi:transposase [Streptomyces sp. NPDC004284]|uniref:transposase n=1 Tax=Streptomyces sp. NPDC004284 TaxID=3364695 RepID=UPI00367B86D6